MRICRFSAENKIFLGVIEGEAVYGIGENFSQTLGDADDIRKIMKGASVWRLSSIGLLSPVMPSKIVAIGLNYKAHAAEFNKPLPEEPMIFLKPPTAVIGPGDSIIYPSHMSHRVDYEGELALVIGRKAKYVPVERAKDYILGYTCFNDVTARDLQGKDIQYTRAKGFDTFACVGPWIETGLDPFDVRIETYLNKEKRQDTSTSDMIFNVYELLSFVSYVMTLLPGDIITTGTPSGVGKMKPGDTVEVRIDGIGSLINTVAARV